LIPLGNSEVANLTLGSEAFTIPNVPFYLLPEFEFFGFNTSYYNNLFLIF
jgi:hypothetical protein